MTRSDLQKVPTRVCIWCHRALTTSVYSRPSHSTRSHPRGVSKDATMEELKLAEGMKRKEERMLPGDSFKFNIESIEENLIKLLPPEAIGSIESID